ncbi:MAG: large subunit ribosomal protein L30e [Thermoplasmata archaeon]|jgi:large subunit ribosomal protein L30e|nr:large subunit ribosomal protein L30e [Thermoplasmata archaeon]
MDVQRSLRTVIATGKVLIGADQTAKAVARGEAKLVILAQNAPEAEGLRAAAQKKRIPVYAFEGMGTQLGPACGKPFSISAIAVLDAGTSDVLQLAK